MYNIIVKNSKCEGPFNCGKCFQICPQLVFFTYPKLREAYKITKKWNVKAAFPDLCLGCMQCIEVCPTNAILIKEVN